MSRKIRTDELIDSEGRIRREKDPFTKASREMDERGKRVTKMIWGR